MRRKYYYIIIVFRELLTDAMGILLYYKYYHGTLVTITRQLGSITVLSWEYRKNTTKVWEGVPKRYCEIPMIIMFGMRHSYNFVGIFRFCTNSVFFTVYRRVRSKGAFSLYFRTRRKAD
jgi:hypothetical protein